MPKSTRFFPYLHEIKASSTVNLENSQKEIKIIKLENKASMQCNLLLCCAVLCCAVLCCAVLCCAVLCC